MLSYVAAAPHNVVKRVFARSQQLTETVAGERTPRGREGIGDLCEGVGLLTCMSGYVQGKRR